MRLNNFSENKLFVFFLKEKNMFVKEGVFQLVEKVIDHM